MDLTEGVIWKKLILYAGPVVLSSLLQSAYSITDLIVAGMVYWQGWHFRHQQRQSGYDDFNPNYHGNYHRGQHSHGAVFWQQGPVQPGQDESDDVRFRPVCGGASVRAALPA